MNIKKLVSTFIIVGGFFSGFSFAENSQEFTDKDAAIFYIKYNKKGPNDSPKDYAKDWMKKYYPEVWNEFENNEFELPDKIAEVKQNMDEEVSKFDTNSTYLFSYGTKLGKYDFNQQQFVLGGLEEFRNNSIGYSMTSNTYSSYIETEWDNDEDIAYLKMDKDTAKQLVNNIDSDRKLRIDVYAKIVNKRSKNSKYDNTLVAHITRCVVTAKDKDGNTITVSDIKLP